MLLCRMAPSPYFLISDTATSICTFCPKNQLMYCEYARRFDQYDIGTSLWLPAVVVEPEDEDWGSLVSRLDIAFIMVKAGWRLRRQRHHGPQELMSDWSATKRARKF